MMPENHRYQTRLLHVYFSEQHLFSYSFKLITFTGLFKLILKLKML